MNFDIRTIVLCLSLTLVTQAIAVFVQYKVNRTYRGIGWWLLASICMALGFIFMPLVTNKSLMILAMIANPLVILGHILIYTGIIKFLEIEENKWPAIYTFLIYLLAYYYYMFFENNMSARTVVTSVTMAVVLIMTAYKLYTKKNKHFAASGNFTAAVFLAYGCFALYHLLFALVVPPMQTYDDNRQMLVISFIIPIIVNALWSFGFIIMLNQRLNAENREGKEKMQMVFNTSPNATLITRLSDGLFVDANAAYSMMSGYAPEELIRSSALEMKIWHNMSDRKCFVRELEDKGLCKNMEFVFQRKDGSQFVGVISATIIDINNQAHVVSVLQDISEKRQAEKALMESEELYRSILSASPDDITITDLEGRIMMLSTAANKLFGYADGEGIGLQILDFIVPEDVPRAQANIKLLYQGGNTGTNEYRAVRKDGSIFNIEVNSGFIHGANGQPIKMLFVVRDISQRKQTEGQIQALLRQLQIERNTAQLNSITDSLTGLANRRYFDEALTKEFFRMQRAGAALSLIMLDVDHFKKFNDRYGHLAGDDCLRQIGAALTSIVGRVPDIVARYGGEEFVLILPETGSDGAATLSERIRSAVEALAIPHATSETAKCVTVSLGIATVFPAEISSPQELVKMADEAMYCAKQSGRNRIAAA